MQIGPSPFGKSPRPSKNPEKLFLPQIATIIEGKKPKKVLSIIVYIYPQTPKKVKFPSDFAYNRGGKPKK